MYIVNFLLEWSFSGLISEFNIPSLHIRLALETQLAYQEPFSPLWFLVGVVTSYPNSDTKRKKIGPPPDIQTVDKSPENQFCFCTPFSLIQFLFLTCEKGDYIENL